MTAPMVAEQVLVTERSLSFMRSGPVPQATAVGAQRPISRLMLGVEIVVAVIVMSCAALLTGGRLQVAAVVGAGALLMTYQPGRDAVRPGLPRPGRVGRDMAIPFAAAGVACAAGWLEQVELQTALAVVGAAGIVTLAAAALRHAFMSGIRVVVVGPAAEVATTFSRLDKERRVQLVGTLVVEEGQEDGPPSECFEAQDPKELILGFRPDVVMVLPGPGVSSECVRRIGWALEGSGAGLAVRSELEGVSAHRIQHTRMADMSVMQIRSSRPSWLVRGLKTVGDRLGALILIAFCSPVLAVLVGLIRATSPGAGIFTQIRIGRNGQPFTMYKLRTMRQDAESSKDLLREVDEGNGLLFKKECDPRVTTVGRLLRKYSLDEVPQLINVLKGDMSLIGPRPALPDEVARFTSMERRRLAVRPGMTGAWQVSGRSTLGRDESMFLDLDYTDNYRLVDDAMIALRTVDAVVRPKGAW